MNILGISQRKLRSKDYLKKLGSKEFKLRDISWILYFKGHLFKIKDILKSFKENLSFFLKRYIEIN